MRKKKQLTGGNTGDELHVKIIWKGVLIYCIGV